MTRWGWVVRGVVSALLIVGLLAGAASARSIVAAPAHVKAHNHRVVALRHRATVHKHRRVPALAHGHAYRRGVVPPRRPGVRATAAAAGNLAYGGGVGGVGVTTGAPQVYVVYWGSQWGTQSAPPLSGDPSAMAPYLDSFLTGIGTGSETWSGVMTQYCQGVATGSQTCPSSAAHVGYPTGGALKGVWVDNATAAPSQASGHQLAAEAARAADHWPQITDYRNVQIVVVSPHGTHPDGFNTVFGQFCAWHDYTGDSTLSGGGGVAATHGSLAFTNLPYITDMGTSCGKNFVNAGSAGTLDGVSIVEGHEYAETITDQFPAGGWTDSSGNENGDKCAWISSGQGASQDIALNGSQYAVQSTWANDYNSGAGGCEITHPVVSGSGGGANTVTVTNPGNQTNTAGSPIPGLQISASDSGNSPLTYTATGLPAGLSINSGSGLITGTPSTAGTSNVTVTATDGTGASGSTSFTWTINAAGSSTCTAKQLLGNPGFETGSAAPWSATAGVISNASAGEPAHSGSWLAWLDGYGTTHTDTITQAVSIPSGCTNYTFSFWLHIDTAETTKTTAYDTLKVQVLNSSGAVVSTLATYSNLNAASGYQQRSFSVAAYAGQTVTLKFTGSEDSSLQTSFVVDDTALNVS